MKEEEDTTSKKISAFAILVFVITLFLCLVELDFVNTPVDAYLQRGSAILGVLAKPALTVWKWLV